MFVSSNPLYTHLHLALCPLASDTVEHPHGLPCVRVGLGQWETKAGEWRQQSGRWPAHVVQLHPSLVISVPLLTSKSSGTTHANFSMGSLLLGSSTAVSPHCFRPRADNRELIDVTHYPSWFPYILSPL